MIEFLKRIEEIDILSLDFDSGFCISFISVKMQNKKRGLHNIKCYTWFTFLGFFNTNENTGCNFLFTRYFWITKTKKENIEED